MTYWRIDPKTRRLIVRDLTPSIRGLLASLSSTVANNAESISEQETLNFLTGRVIRSILFALWPLDWENTDLWDIDWEEWIEPVVLESDYNTSQAATQRDNRILMLMGL